MRSVECGMKSEPPHVGSYNFKTRSQANVTEGLCRVEMKLA